MQILLSTAGGTYTFNPTLATVTISGVTLTVDEIDSIINVTRDNRVLYDINDTDELTLVGSTFQLTRSTYGMLATDTLQIIIEVAGGGTGTGDVVGPGSAVGDHVVFFNSTTGKLIKDSGLTLSGTNTGDQTGGTPALILGTTNAAGTSTHFIRDDDTILAFDATAPSTQAFGDAAAVGAATVAARRDHKHAMPATPDLSALATKSGLQAESYIAADDTGTANSYAITITPTPTLGVYSAFSFKVAHTNTAPSTLQVNANPSKPIYKWGGVTPLAGGELVAGQIVRVIYDGTNYQMQSQSASGPIYQPPEYNLGTVTTAVTITPLNGSRQKMTLTNAQACAMTFTQPTYGTVVIGLKIIQSAAGSFNGTISGGKWASGAVPVITQTTGAVDFISIYLDGTNAYCAVVGQDLR